MIELFITGLLFGVSPILFLIIFMWDELKLAWKVRIAKSRHIPLMLLADTAGYLKLLYVKYIGNNKIIAYDRASTPYTFKLESDKHGRIDFYFAGAKTFLGVDKKHRVLSVKDLLELNIISNPILRQELWGKIYQGLKERYIDPLRKQLYAMFREWLTMKNIVFVEKTSKGKEKTIPAIQLLSLDNFDKDEFENLFLDYLRDDERANRLYGLYTQLIKFKPDTPEFEELSKVLENYNLNLKFEIENRPLDFGLIKADSANPIDMSHLLITGFSAGFDQRMETEMPIKKTKMNILSIIVIAIVFILLFYIMMIIIPQAVTYVTPRVPPTGQGVRP